MTVDLVGLTRELALRILRERLCDAIDFLELPHPKPASHIAGCTDCLSTLSFLVLGGWWLAIRTHNDNVCEALDYTWRLIYAQQSALNNCAAKETTQHGKKQHRPS